jgi:hypothetical protein
MAESLGDFVSRHAKTKEKRKFPKRGARAEKAKAEKDKK